MINSQNKKYRNHARPNQHCYINATKMNHILAFHHWALFSVKDSWVEYDTASVTAFYCYWVDSILDEYFMEDNNVTFQSTEFLVTTPPFIGTNWYEVKYHMV